MGGRIKNTCLHPVATCVKVWMIDDSKGSYSGRLGGLTAMGWGNEEKCAFVFRNSVAEGKGWSERACHCNAERTWEGEPHAGVRVGVNDVRRGAIPRALEGLYELDLGQQANRDLEVGAEAEKGGQGHGGGVGVGGGAAVGGGGGSGGRPGAGGERSCGGEGGG